MNTSYYYTHAYLHKYYKHIIYNKRNTRRYKNDFTYVCMRDYNNNINNMYEYN